VGNDINDGDGSVKKRSSKGRRRKRGSNLHLAIDRLMFVRLLVYNISLHFIYRRVPRHNTKNRSFPFPSLS